MTTAKTSPSPDDRFVTDCLRYLDGEMTEQEFADFQARLEADPALQQRFVELNLLSEYIAEASGSEHAEEVLAMADLVTRTQVIRSVTSNDLKKVGGLEAFSLVSYLAWQTARNHALAIGSIAAALLLGVVLFFTLSPNENNTPPKPAASTHSTPRGSEAKTPPIVATLTAERDAVWSNQSAEGPLAPGSPLRAGQRLTLTQGFAEITTNHGAIAILQAPTTIEISGANTVGLKRGQLSAQVPPIATGFTVEAPGITLVDIGTAFSVQVGELAASQQTHAYVYEGQVVAKPDGPGLEDKLLSHGDGLRAEVGEAGVVDIQYNPAANLARANFIRHFDEPGQGISEVRGNIQWLEDAPRTVATSRNERSQEAILFAERRSLDVRPLTGLKIDRSSIGTPVIEHGPQAPETTLGQVMLEGTIDVYLVHFDPVGDEVEDEAYFDATLAFEGEVIGVIYKAQGLMVSDALLGSPTTTYDAFQNRGFDKGDLVTLLEDRRTVRLRAGASLTDQVRILVRPDTNP